MKCPLCKTEMRITSTRYVTENDDTDTLDTKLFIEQDLSCRNKNCSNFEKVVEATKTEIPIG